MAEITPVDGIFKKKIIEFERFYRILVKFLFELENLVKFDTPKITKFTITNAIHNLTMYHVVTKQRRDLHIDTSRPGTILVDIPCSYEIHQKIDDYTFDVISPHFYTWDETEASCGAEEIVPIRCYTIFEPSQAKMVARSETKKAFRIFR